MCGLTLAVALALAPGPFAAGAARAESALERIQSEGVAAVGFANEVPYGYLTADGELTGEAPEVLRVILKRLGVGKIDGVLTEFGGLIPGLKAERVDIIAAGMYVTPRRCRQIAFSEPTYAIGNAFAVPEGNPKDLHSFEQVAENPDVRLGVMAGAIESTYARAVGVKRSQFVVFPDVPSALDGVRAGRADAFAGTDLTIRKFLEKNPKGLEQAKPFRDPVVEGHTLKGYGAFGFRKEDVGLREAVNAELAKFIGTPQHLELVEPFGFTKENLPDLTTEELCAGAANVPLPERLRGR